MGLYYFGGDYRFDAVGCSGWFNADWRFYSLWLAHIVLLEIIAVYCIASLTSSAPDPRSAHPGANVHAHPQDAVGACSYGSAQPRSIALHGLLESTAPCSWGWWTGVLLLTTVQIQAGWLQHDFGHLSVFKSSRLNHIAHWFVICQSVAEADSAHMLNGSA